MSDRTRPAPRRSAWGAVTVAALLLGLGALAGCRAPARPSTAPLTTASATASAAASATPRASGAPSSTPDATAGWARYSDVTDQFSLRYPPAWLQRTCVVDVHTSLFLAPSSPALGVCNSGFGGQMYVGAATGDQRTVFALTGYPDLVNTTVTVNGVTGMRQSATVSAATDMGPAVGTRLVKYLFFTHGRTYQCNYTQGPSGPTSTNLVADFDLMVTGTLAFTA